MSPLASQDDHLMSQRDKLELQWQLRKRNERRETTANRIATMPPEGMGTAMRWPANRSSPVVSVSLTISRMVWRDFSFSVSAGQTKKFLSAGFTEVTQSIAVVTISYGYA